MKCKKPKKINIDSLESLNNQITKLKISLQTTESMRDIAQAKFDAQQIKKIDAQQKQTTSKKSTKRNSQS